MKSVVLAALAFAVCSAVPSLLVSGTILYSQSPRRPDAADDFLMAAYLVAASSSLATIGFAIPTAFSALWRRLPAARAMIIAAPLGIASPVAGLLGAAISSIVLLPLLRRAIPIGAVLFFMTPGVILGAVALLIAKALPTKR